MNAASVRRLRCDNCGAPALGDLALIAKEGGPHFASHTRHAEPGRKSEGRFQRLTTCGRWTYEDVTVKRPHAPPVRSRIPGEDDGD